MGFCPRQKYPDSREAHTEMRLILSSDCDSLKSARVTQKVLKLRSGILLWHT